jgi:hypothetical protein
MSGATRRASSWPAACDTRETCSPDLLSESLVSTPMALVCRSRVSSDLRSSGGTGGLDAAGAGAAFGTCIAGTGAAATTAGGCGAVVWVTVRVVVGSFGTAARTAGAGSGARAGSIWDGWAGVSGAWGASTTAGVVRPRRTISVLVSSAIDRCRGDVSWPSERAAMNVGTLQ